MIHLVLEHQGERNQQPRIVDFLVAFRNADVQARRVDVRGSAGVAHIRDHLHRRPRARMTRQSDGQQAVIEDLLDVAGIKQGHPDVVKTEIALMGDGGAFRNVIVAAKSQRRAIPPRAGDVRVAKDVA